MPKKRDYPEPKPATIFLEEGRPKLLVMREKGVKILENRRFPKPVSRRGQILRSIVRVSRARFEAGHYADAVEAAFKELKSEIKEHVRKATG
jgi:hypothetical protein